MSDAGSDNAEGAASEYMEYPVATEVVEMTLDNGSVQSVSSAEDSDSREVRISELTQMVLGLRTQCSSTRDDRVAAEEAESTLRKELTSEQGIARESKLQLRVSDQLRTQLAKEVAELTERLATVDDKVCNVPLHGTLMEDIHQLRAQCESKEETIRELEAKCVLVTQQYSDRLTSRRESGRLSRNISRLVSTHEDQEFSVGGAEGDVNESEINKLIPGSEAIIPGGILAKKGASSFGFNQENGYSLIMQELDEEYRAIEEEKAESGALSVPDDEMYIQKLLKQAGVIMNSHDNLEKFEVPSQEEMSSDWIGKLLTKLQQLQIISLTAADFGWMDEYADCVGAPEDMKTWPR